MIRLPRIAFVGNEAITTNHGTGMMFARHFSNYPKSKMIDVHFRTAGTKYFFPKISVESYDLGAASWKDPWVQNINKCLAGEKAVGRMSLVYQNRIFAPVNVNWDKFGGPPDLIYSTCFSSLSFAFLHHFYRSLPKKVPIVQHFLDLDLRNTANLVSLYREFLPVMAGVWTLTKPIYDVVSKFSVWKPEMVQALHQYPSRSYKRIHRKLSKDFSSVLIGNVWSGGAYQSLYNIWSHCQKNLNVLPPVTWVGHPRRFTVLKDKNISVESGSVIRDMGLVSDRRLNSLLCEADIAIVAFSGNVIDDDQYISFSLPSRIGDYCAKGLPIVVISQKGTEPCRIVEENGLGIVLDPFKERQSALKLEKFIFDKEWRMECGQNARNYMARELNLYAYQKLLYPRLAELSAVKIPQKALVNFQMGTIEK